MQHGRTAGAARASDCAAGRHTARQLEASAAGPAGRPRSRLPGNGHPQLVCTRASGSWTRCGIYVFSFSPSGKITVFFFFFIFTREGLCFSYECRFLNRGVFSWSPPSVAGWSGRSRSRRCQPSPGKTAYVRCLTPPVRELVVNGGRLTFWGRSILCSKI